MVVIPEKVPFLMGADELGLFYDNAAAVVFYGIAQDAVVIGNGYRKAFLDLDILAGTVDQAALPIIFDVLTLAKSAYQYKRPEWSKCVFRYHFAIFLKTPAFHDWSTGYGVNVLN